MLGSLRTWRGRMLVAIGCGVRFCGQALIRAQRSQGACASAARSGLRRVLLLRLVAGQALQPSLAIFAENNRVATELTGAQAPRVYLAVQKRKRSVALGAHLPE